jgi:hypothetical protein
MNAATSVLKGRSELLRWTIYLVSGVLLCIFGLFALGDPRNTAKALAALSFCVLAFAVPDVLLVAMAFVIPLFPKLPFIAIKSYVIPVRLDDLLIFFAALVILVRALYGRRLFRKSPGVIWILLFLATCAISNMWAVAVLDSVDIKTCVLYFQRLVEYFLVLFFCIYEVHQKQQYLRLLQCSMVALFLVGIYGIMQRNGLVPSFNAMHEGAAEFLDVVYGEGDYFRLTSTFGGPYEAAGYYVVLIPVAVSLWLAGGSKLRRRCLGATAILSLACLEFTQARIAVPSIVVAFAVIFVLLRKKALGAVLCAAAVSPALLLQAFADRFSAFTSGNPLSDPSLQMRIYDRWVIAWNAFRESPLIGTGLGSLDKRGFGVDGLYALLLGMVGVMGVAFFLVLIGEVAAWQLRVLRSKPNLTHLKSLAVGLVAATSGLVVYSTFTEGFFISKVATSYWFLNGLLYAGYQIDLRDKAKLKQARAFSPAAPAGFGARGPAEAAFAMARPAGRS